MQSVQQKINCDEPAAKVAQNAQESIENNIDIECH